MRNTKISFFITLLLFSYSILNAQYPVKIGSDNAFGDHLPYNNEFEFNWCAALYPQSKIDAHGDIVKISYRLSMLAGAGETASNQKVYMAHTSDVKFADNSYPNTASMTLVYEGDISYMNYFNFSAVTEITLTTPFAYNNADNLIVYIENHSGNKVFDSNVFLSVYSEMYTSTSYMCKYNSQDGSFPATSGTLINRLPIIYLGFDSGLDVGINTLNNDITNLLPGTHDIIVDFRNYMGDTISSCEINYEINGVLQTPVNWSGTLYTGQVSNEINLVNDYDFAPGIYQFKVWTNNPNGETDELNTNDTVSLTLSVANYIEVGNNSYNNTLYPSPSYNRFGWSSSIYGKDSIQYGNISGIAYNNVNQGYLNDNQKIYLSQTSETTYSSAELPAEGSMNLVYEGSIDYSDDTGWKKTLFDASFDYNADNLVVHYQNHSGQSNPTSTSFVGTTYGHALTKYNGDNTSFPIAAGSTSSRAADVRLYFSLPSDAGISVISEPYTSFHTGLNEIKVNLKNYGTDQLTSADIKYQVDNGAIESNTWSGDMALYESAIDISIGSYDFSYGDHFIKVWTENPNGFTDYNNDNDTISISVFAGSPLNGNYIIGPEPSDFTTLTEAVDSLNCSSGISGSVIFDIKPGSYNSQNSLSEINGANDLFYVTFRSQTGDSTDVILTTDFTDFNFALSGADNIIFKQVTFSTNVTTGTIVKVENFSNRILFESCVFTGNDGSGILLSSVNNDYTYDKGLNINNNLFLNGSTAIDIDDKGVIVSNNHFSNQITYGIDYVSYDSLLIRNNVFTGGQWAIYGSGNSITISENIFSNNVYGAFRLMGADYIVKNNMANVFGNSSLMTSVYLNIVDSKFYNNTILKQEGYDFGLVSIYGDNSDFKNNIFINYDNKEILYLPWGADGNTFDHNLYYTNGTVLANKNGQDYLDLPDWQSGTSQDLNSIFESVNFVSDTDLHTKSLIVDGAGTPVSEVDRDFDDEIRDAVNPDIGADEFVSLCVSPLVGTYTVGVTGTYSGFAEVTEALNFCGISGDVLFLIEDGSYNTQLLFGNSIPGQNSYNIVFRSASSDSSKVIIEFDANSDNNYVIKLDGADHFSFEHMSIKSLNPDYGRVVELVNQADNNTFSNLIIEGSITDKDSKELALIYSNENETANEGVIFNANVLNYGSFGVYIESNRYKNVHTYSNNIFTNQKVGGVYCYQAGYVDILSNTINRSLESGLYNAVYSDYSDSITVDKCKLSIASEDASNGIMIISGKHTLINNFIHINTVGSERFTGIYSGGNVWMYNNSVSMTGSGTNTLATDLTQIGESKIQNNIFSNSAGGPAIYMQTWSNPQTMDYNCLYSSGEFLTFRGTNYKTLSEWTAATSFDANSVSLNPAFLSESDLHTSAVLLNGNALAIDMLTTDIDGEARDAINPDIGADEFSALIFSLGEDVFTCVDDEIVIKAGNGFDTYLWSTGSDSSSTVIDSTDIGYGEKEISVIVELGAETYKDTIKVYFSSPIAAPIADYCFNEDLDSIQISAGNAASYSWYHGPTSQSVYITSGSWYRVTVTDEKGCTDQADITIHYNFCIANLNMPQDTTIYYTEPIVLDANSGCDDAESIYYSYLWNTGETSEKITVDISEYALGTHTFSVTIIDKSSLCESADTVNITLSFPIGINDADNEQELIIFPNPSDGMFQIQGENINSIEVFNLQGQLLQILKGNKDNVIDLSQYSKGIYFVKVFQEDRYFIQKLILE